MNVFRSAMRMMLVAICLFSGTAAYADGPAITITAAGKAVNLLLPEHTCAYDAAQKPDARILDAMERANPESQVLVAFIDCGNLSAIRGVKDASYGPGYYGQATSDIAGQTVADNYTREAYVKAIAVQYGTDMPSKAMERGERALKELADENNTQEGTQTIGVIKQGADFLQVAVMGSQKGPTGALQKNVNIITLTKLGVPVSITVGHPVTPGMTLHDFSDRIELYTRQVLLMNPEELPPFSKGIDKWSFLLGLACGATLMLIIVFLSKGRS